MNEQDLKRIAYRAFEAHLGTTEERVWAAVQAVAGWTPIDEEHLPNPKTDEVLAPCTFQGRTWTVVSAACGKENWTAEDYITNGWRYFRPIAPPPAQPEVKS